MRKVLFVIPGNYKEVGGMRLPMENYFKYLSNSGYQVETAFMPYHVNELIKNKNVLLQEIQEKSKDAEAIIGYPINQAYLMVKFFYKYIVKKRYIAFLADSMILYQESVMEKRTDISRLIKSIIRKYLYKYKEEYIIRNTQKIILSSTVDIEFLCKHYPKWSKRFRYLPNGISIPTNVYYTESRQKNSLTIGCLTGFSKDTMEENLLPLIEGIIPALIKKGLNVKLVIAGRGATKEIEDYLKEKSYIDYLGFVNQLDDFYKSIDIVISTVYKKCGIINRILEAWSYGKVVIGYSHNFFTFQEAEAGLHYISANSKEEYFTEISKILEGEYDLNSMGRACRKLVEEHYRWERYGKELIDIIYD